MSKRRRNIYLSRYNKKLRTARYSRFIITSCAFLVLAAIIFLALLFYGESKSKIRILDSDVAAFNISYGVFTALEDLAKKYNIEFYEILTYYCVYNNFFPDEAIVFSREEIERDFMINYQSIKASYSSKDIEPYVTLMKSLFEEIKYFPIPASYSGGLPEYIYGNSWGALREYGGERKHEGTDIVDRENIRGRIPIVSMTNGTIEHIGWNELGGYRIGIRGESGTYYYYAHMDSFDDGLAKGDTVSAGSLLGYMGDTGYSKKEGTTGNFVVHLHVGISPKFKDSDFWINPYIFLRHIESYKVPAPIILRSEKKFAFRSD